MLRNVSISFGFLAVIALTMPLSGTVRAQQFVTELPPPPTYAEVKVSKLNVRAAASKDAELITQLDKGDLIPLKKAKDGWVRLAWEKKAFVFEDGIIIPEGQINKKPRYEDMREIFIDLARKQDPTIQWLEVPRASGIEVRYHWREYRDRAALIARAEKMARMYSVMTTGEQGIWVDIVSGNDSWARAFY
ncbi:MAG: hypothetical protein ACE5FN_06035 [Leptospirillia bacterium]